MAEIAVVSLLAHKGSSTRYAEFGMSLMSGGRLSAALPRLGSWNLDSLHPSTREP